MSEDAPVNTGAVAWPDYLTASVTVRRMQAKLHRWAAEDPGRRFGDLFNLVCDPAFLVHARERVSTNEGARTAGIDKATAATIEASIGVGAFLGLPGPDPGLAENGRVPAGRSTAGDDPER
jgi:RNA-directed DNA polymerase